MKNILKLLFLSTLSVNNTALLTSCSLSFGKSRPDLFNNNKEYFDEVLLDKTKAKLEANLINGSTLDELLPIGSQNSKSEILKLINDFADYGNKFDIVFTSPEENLSQTNNTVDINLLYNKKQVYVRVKFKNVKPYSQSKINGLFCAVESKFICSVDGKKIREDALISANKHLLTKKIKNIINDERISVVIQDSWQNIKQANYKIKFEITVNHKIFYKKQLLTLTLINVNNIQQKYSQPKYDQSKHSQPNKSQSKYDQSKHSQPNNSQPKYDQSKHSQPNNSQPKYDQSKHSQPNNSQPKYDQPKHSQSNNSQPKYDQPKYSEPKYNQQNDELDSNKLTKITNATFYDLIGVNYDWCKNIKKLKKDYRLFQLYIHEDKIMIFFKDWYGKVNNNNVSENFNKIYTALFHEVFKILKDDFEKVETIFKTLNSYDNKILKENKIINKFYRYLKEINKHINGKKKDEESKWSMYE